MIIYIYGEDSFRSRQYLKEQVKKFKTARDPQGYNVVFVNAKTAEAGKIMSEIVAAPFLAEKRMVILENVLSVSDKDLLGQLIKRSQTTATPPTPPLKRGEGVKSFPESNIIVFYQSEPLSKVKEAKELDVLLRKEKYAKEFESLYGDKLYGWTAGEIKARGGKISRAALTYLCDNIAGDMWHLNTLLDQLVAYTTPSSPPSEGGDSEKGARLSPPYEGGVAPQGGGGREIQLADVQLFLEEKLDDNIFNLTDAIVAGNRKLAFKLLDDQRQLGEEDGKIFGTILWQFRVLMSMRDLFERQDMKSDEMARVLKLHPFVVKKNLPIIKKYSSEKLRAVYRQLLEIDIKTKTGLADQSMLLDLFVGARF